MTMVVLTVTMIMVIVNIVSMMVIVLVIIEIVVIIMIIWMPTTNVRAVKNWKNQLRTYHKSNGRCMYKFQYHHKLHGSCSYRLCTHQSSLSRYCKYLFNNNCIMSLSKIEFHKCAIAVLSLRALRAFCVHSQYSALQPIFMIWHQVICDLTQ